jgi:hypothetical protein
MRMSELFQHLPLAFSAIFVAILFIQSGLDKVFNYKGNLEWITGHFSKTFLAGTVPMMFATLTVLEVVTGFGSLIGLIYFLVTGAAAIIFWASVVGAVTLCALFFGQRLTQDYPGAAVLVPYFILILIMMHLSNAQIASR